jgi:hypothetical protein
MAFIISADDIKQTLPGYDPSHSDVLHSESAKLADKAYEKALKTRSENTVVLMSGGSASGKTEYISAYLRNRKVIVLDGTLPTFDGAKIKIQKALKQNKKIEVHGVLPVDMKTAFIAFLNRDRKFPPEHFFRTHSSSRKTLLEIARNFPDIDVRIVFSKNPISNNKVSMSFTKLWIPDRSFLIDFLSENQYTESELKRIQGLHDI